MFHIRTVVASIILGGLAGCSPYSKPMPRTEKALEHIEKLDDNDSIKVTINKLGCYGRYLADRDLGIDSNLEFSDQIEEYYRVSYGKDEEYISLHISKTYLEEARKNNAITKERYLFLKKIFESYENQDLILKETFPSLGEIRNAIYEKRLIDLTYKSGVINEKEYAWFNSEDWVKERRPLNQVNEMIENISNLDYSSNELITALIFSKDYIVANKIFQIYSKGLLSEEAVIKLLDQSNKFFQDSNPNFSYLGGLRAQFLFKFVFPKALKEARDSDLISEQNYNDIKSKSQRDLQDETRPRYFSHLTAEVSCLLYFEKLGFIWKKEYKLGNRFTTADLARPFNEPFENKYEMVFKLPEYNNNQPQQQALSGN